MPYIFTRIQVAVATGWGRDDGQGLTEYALILALIAIVAIAGLRFLGGHVTSELSSVSSSL